MKDLSIFTKRYLSIATNYAIQISGKWGRGKTHYIKNDLIPIIEETESFSDSLKKYIPIYISLFGIKSIEDIDTKIVFELIQSKTIGKGSFQKISKHITSIFFKGFLNFNKLGKSEEFIEDSKEIAKTILDFNQLVLVFDDLERKSKNIDYIEIIGFINHLVDIGIKVIIVANDDKILEINEQNFKDIKSKTIGISLEYIPDNELIIDSIIKDYSDYKNGYYSFLKEYKFVIVEFAKIIDFNYRNLKYSLNLIQDIYSTIENNKSEFEEYEWKTYEIKKEDVLKFCLFISDLYKNSRISASDYEIFYERTKIRMDWFNKGEKREKTKLEELHSCYFPFSNKEVFFLSIFNFLTMKENFSFEDFKNEFLEYYQLRKEILMPHSLVLKKLDYLNIPKLSDTEYKKLTSEMLNYANDGLYLPLDYLTVYNYSERFENILNLNLELISKNILNGFKKSVKKSDISNLPTSYYRMSISSDSSELLRKMGLLMSDYIDKIREKDSYIKTKEVLITIFNSSEYYSDLLIKNGIDYNYKIKHNLFEVINTNELVVGISNMKNFYNFNLFINIFQERYLTVDYSGAPESFNKYKSQLKKMDILINKLGLKHKEMEISKNNKLKCLQIKQFIEKLKNIYAAAISSGQ